MSFDLLAARSWGSGTLGNVTNPAQINHYAAVTAVANKNITLAADDLSAFTPGTEILLHISGVRNSSAAADKLGLYKFAKIMSVADNVLTLNVKALTADPAQYFYQAITVPHYKTLTISNTVAPPAFDESTGCGGILIFKCSSKLVMSGAINLVNKGLTTAAYRPLLNQEQGGILDTDTLSGHENYETAKHFVLNVGDGAALIIAKAINFEDTARIGNPSSYGVARCRGAADSIGTPTNVSNVGGSSILIVANSITDFNAKIIAKYRTKTLDTPKGLGRCYIATESRLPADEGLYAYDIINTPERLKKNTLINGFGSGVLGVAKRPTAQQNNYAKVTKITDGGKTFTLTNITTEGEAKFERGGRFK